MNAAARIAIYFVPKSDTPLAQFGAQAIGYDIWSGSAVALPDLQPYRTHGAALTAEPRRYGFHATLKAPFQLRPGTTLQMLEARAAEFARARPPVRLGRLEVRALGRFLALVPPSPSPDLATLAADCVTEFDELRAPLQEPDRIRRLASGLTERQEHYLEAWGYPFVLDEFRFHMTLTGPVAPPLREELLAALSALWSENDAPIVLDGVTLAVQPTRDAPFRVAAHFPFRTASADAGNA